MNKMKAVVTMAGITLLMPLGSQARAYDPCCHMNHPKGYTPATQQLADMTDGLPITAAMPAPAKAAAVASEWSTSSVHLECQNSEGKLSMTIDPATAEMRYKLTVGTETVEDHWNGNGRANPSDKYYIRADWDQSGWGTVFIDGDDEKWTWYPASSGGTYCPPPRSRVSGPCETWGPHPAGYDWESHGAVKIELVGRGDGTYRVIDHIYVPKVPEAWWSTTVLSGNILQFEFELFEQNAVCRVSAGQ